MPLKITNKIPSEILSKFYVHAYTMESPFYYNLNRDLMLFKGEKYYPFIKTLYKGMDYYHYKDKKKKLYRRTRMSESEINKLKKVLKSKDKHNKNENNKIPKVLFYSRTFLSFSERKEIAMGFNGNVLLELQLDYLNLDDIQSNSNIKKYSRFSEEEEILFYPFFSFSIENITEENGLIKIVLVSLGKYKEATKQIFNKYKNKNFKCFQKQASKTDFYKMINKTKYIKPIDALEISYTKITEKPFDKEEVQDFINENFDKVKFKIGTEVKEITEDYIQYEEKQESNYNNLLTLFNLLNNEEKSQNKESDKKTLNVERFVKFIIIICILISKGKQKRKIIKRRKYMVYYDLFSDGTSKESYRQFLNEDIIQGNWEYC